MDLRAMLIPWMATLGLPGDPKGHTFMTSKTARYPVMIGVKISRETERELRRRADADNRPVASFIRHTLLKALQEQPQTEPEAAR